MPRRGEIIAERYRLEREIGSGAMGEVWLARHVRLDTPVAVKIIGAEAARHTEAVARFEREAVVAARIQSAHVVKMLDHGRHEGRPYIVMEYLEGVSLRERINARGRLSAQETAQVVRHVGRALAAAHAVGLVHRDIKPENVFIARLDDDEVIKVLDFGVAKVTDELMASGIDPTRTGALLGTPFYLSPEQARGLKTLDHRADLWSLGVLTFECLTGKRPFSAHAMGPLLAKIMQGPIPSPSQLAPDAQIGPEIDRWMARALTRDPGGRFASAEEMAQAFSVAAGVADSVPLEPSAPAPASQGDPSVALLDRTVALPERDESLGATLALPEAPESQAPRPQRPRSNASLIDAPWPEAPPPPRRAPFALIAVAGALSLAVAAAILLTRDGDPSAPPPATSSAPATASAPSTSSTGASSEPSPPAESDEPRAAVDPPAPAETRSISSPPVPTPVNAKPIAPPAPRPTSSASANPPPDLVHRQEL